MNKNGELSSSRASVEYVNGIPGAPTPPPFFSQLVWAGDTAYLAGQIGLDPVTSKLVEGGLVAETERTITNIEAVLAGAGLGLVDVARVTVYLTETTDIPIMNEIYLRRLGTARPAREMTVVKGLAFGAKIEMTVIAYKSR